MAPKKQASTSCLATPKVTKKYSSIRAPKKSEAEWNRYKPLFKRLWIKENYSVEEIRRYVWVRHREDLSARQIQHRMEKWGWTKYKTEKRDKGSDATDEGSVLPESEDDIGSAASDDEEPMPTLDDHFDSEMFDMADDTQLTRCVHYAEPVKLQADVAMALGDPKSAFEIYVKLCDDTIQAPCFRSTPTDLLLTACFRAARDIPEEQRAAKLLERFETDPLHQPELALQMSLLKACVDYPRTTAGEAALRQLARGKLDSTRWSGMTRPFTVADLGTWRAIIQVLWLLQDKNGNAPPHDQNFLMSQPVKSWVTSYGEHDTGKPTAFLDCLEWATKKLLETADTPLQVPQFVQEIKVDGTNYQCVNYLILFLSLLEVAFREQRELAWWLQSEPETSISPITLLGAVCRMILNEPPFDENPQPSLQKTLIQGPDSTTILRPKSSLATAAQEISLRASDYLWSSFLATLAEEDESDPLEGTMLVYVRQYMDTLSQAQDQASSSLDKVNRYLDTLPNAGGSNGHDLSWSMDPPFTEEFFGAAELPFVRPLTSSFNEYHSTS